MHELLYQKGKNWSTDLTPAQKNGTMLVADMECSPIFTGHRDLIES